MWGKFEVREGQSDDEVVLWPLQASTVRGISHSLDNLIGKKNTAGVHSFEQIFNAYCMSGTGLNSMDT